MVELEWAELDIPRLLTRPAGVPGDGARLTAPPHLYTEVLHFEAIRVVDPRAMAFTNVSGRADADVHVFYNRVAGFEDRVHMPEFLGNVLAHELAHALQGVARHSLEGLMKAVWSARDYAEMVSGPLAFTAEDVELLRARFKREMSPAPTLVPIR
jgi:hypothetical protein